MEYVGKIGINQRNGMNVIFTSLAFPGLQYEFQEKRRSKKNRITFICAGCRQEYDCNRARDLGMEVGVPQIKGFIDADDSSMVKFCSNPDEMNHCCWRRNPNHVKAKQIKLGVREEIKGKGIKGADCIRMINQKVLEADENDDVDHVMQKMGRTDSLRKILTNATNRKRVSPADDSEDLQQESRINNDNPMESKIDCPILKSLLEAKVTEIQPQNSRFNQSWNAAQQQLPRQQFNQSLNIPQMMQSNLRQQQNLMVQLHQYRMQLQQLQEIQQRQQPQRFNTSMPMNFDQQNTQYSPLSHYRYPPN